MKRSSYNMSDKGRAWLAAAGGMLFLLLCSAADRLWLNQPDAPVFSSANRENPPQAFLEPQVELISEEPEEMDAADASEAPMELELDAQQKQMMDVLLEQMELGDCMAVGIVMNEQSAAYQEIFYENMLGTRYLYDGKTFSRNIEGTGLVLDKGNTVFYGSFSNGAPNGECLAVQAVVIDFPRYDYARGVWKDGRMEGFGQAGYEYYQGSELEEAQKVIKEGNFNDNLLDGSVAYTSVNVEGFSATWDIRVKDGIIQLDDRWVADGEDGTFSLMAEEDDTHAYVISPLDLDRVFWQNLILW